MDTVRVLVTDPFEKEGVSLLRQAGFQVDEVGKLSPERLAEVIPGYDCLIVRSGTKVTAEAIRKGNRLKIIGRAGVGLDNIDIKEATACGVIVMNAPEGNTVSAAEHAVGMMFALARRIPMACSSVKSGKWERNKFVGTELYGKTLGIVGFGRIGRHVAKIGKALGMRVLVHDPYVPGRDAEAMEVGFVSLEALLKQADVITFHLPLTEETKGLIGPAQFEQMKDGVMLVNCARGGIIDEGALADALKKGKVGGVALDVFEKEPPEGCPLLSSDAVVATPHLGASTKEAQVNVAVQLAQQIVDALTRRVVRNAVNFPALDEPTLEKLRGYHSLGEKLGSFLRQLAGKPKEIHIQYAGEITQYDLTLLRNHIIVGCLGREERVNIVNAPLVLKEKGAALTERYETKAEEFATLITVEVKGTRKVSAAGTLIRNREERVVRIDDLPVEVALKGHLLVYQNDDVPGVIGRVGTVLGRAGVNIASMTLGRRKKGGGAVTVLNLDQRPDERTVREIEKLQAIRSVDLVSL